MTYEQALAFWFGRVNYEQRMPTPVDLKLDRMRGLLRMLGEPHERLRIIHVAGSKGKGSTAAMLASVLCRSGYRVGLFTSPHLCRVEERIQVDGEPIRPEELTTLLEEVHEAIAGPACGEGEPTFFEIATAVGFLHFVRRRVDVAVLEVGLGGRFDSTNVCRPLVSVITSISLDHTQQLGDCVGLIAREKAGIVKPGRPAVSGATAAKARSVIEKVCRRQDAPLRQLGEDFRYEYEPGRVTDGQANGHGRRPPRVRVLTRRRAWPALDLALLGEHQAANGAVAIACVEELQAQGLSVPDIAVAAGLASVSWPARLEVMDWRPLVVLDCAHNVASAQALVDTLGESFPVGRRLLIFAGSSDKDLPGIIRILAPHFVHAYLTRYADSPRSVPPEQLADLWRRHASIPCTVCASAAAAWEAARAAAGPDDLVCITGSVFLAGELRPVLMASALAKGAGSSGGTLHRFFPAPQLLSSQGSLE